MNPRNALIILIASVCMTAWWQVEARLKAARELNLKLAMEATFDDGTRESHSAEKQHYDTEPSLGPLASPGSVPFTGSSPDF